ncbi:MAG: hypothetical protein NT034_00200 [Candidatus Magasanikbacteria bacterium]|nr:hypothetical protein [Candidatus Magasanikbacteria bacterium]
MFFRKTKKFAVAVLLTLFVFSSFTEFIFSAQPAQAQLPVTVIADAQAQAESIFTVIKNGWKIAVMNAAQQAVGYFLRKVAYDSAVWLAAGGKGQSPFAHTNSVGSYLKNVGNDAAGAAIDSFGKTFGLDLCKIPDVKIDLALRIGLHYNYGANPPKPACNLTTFAKNWGNAASSVYNNGIDPSKIFATSLKVDDSDLGINIKTSEKIDRLYLQQTEDAKATRAEGGGFKAVTGLIDNRIKTPAAVTADEMKANAPNKQNDKSQAQIGAAMGSGAYEIIPSTLSIFLNTLSSQMLKNFKENGMLPFGVGCVNIDGVTGGKCPTPGQNPNSAGSEITGRAAAEAVFNEFLTPKLNTVNDYDILAQLSSCDSHGLYNCRADQSLVQAIQEAKHGDPVTIAQAIQKGWLHGSGKLIPPTNVSMNSDPHCFDKNNYCYSNVAVLRQLGILPLGLEIAAKNSDPDHPATLEEAVKRFYDCSYQKDAQGSVVGVNYDPANYPYCHLVDPNWVIKLEQTRCDALGYGPSSVGNDVPDRLQECVDLKTCVGRDSTGNCLGYGNCVREKNVWKFDADKCDAQYATCRSFTNSQGQQLSYLYRTLDTGSCDQSNVGCTAYSLNQNASGWTVPGAASLSANDNIYLNNKVTSCNASAAGCSAFKLANNDNLVYLKKAPDYLNCYDADVVSSGVNWPQSLSDIIKMTPKAECKDYAQVCIASEVGCAQFKNVNDADAPAIPGKFSPAQVQNNTVTAWNDQCDARCVGYSAYQEMPTTYSAGNPVSYIIPPSKYNNNQSGSECSAQDDGCTSFTNMETSQNGGEKVDNFTLLRNCIKPDDTKQKNFYTYEGSKVGGYQLQAFVLQKYTDGSPLTVFKDQAERDYANQYKCNESLYKNHLADPDCRQFNDDQGKVYYALMPNTVVVSADCSQYRINSPELATASQCFGNGQFKDGSCYYYGLPGGIDSSAGASKTCSASAVSCRAYKGNHGNNIRSIVLNASSSNPIDNFENPVSVTAQNGWTVQGGTIAQSNESNHAGEHSMEVVGTNAVVSKSIPVVAQDVDQASDQSYDLSFWAKGTGINISVGMNNNGGQNVNAGIFSANNTWQLFKFHIKLPTSNTSTLNNLTFTLQSAGSLFLDNLHLTKVSDYIYLVKNSLQIDPICDDNLNDNLPGAALGCTAYNGPKNSLGDTLYYLTNFSYLCRDGAIGCTAFKDTYNKVGDTGPRVYNVFLPVAAPGGVKAVAKIGNDTYSCQVEQGKSGCYVNIKGHTSAEISAGKVNNTLAPVPSDSTYFVPADSTNSTTIYLVADGSDHSSCNAIDLGCTMVGKQTNTPAGVKYVTTTVKIDPNQFEGGADANGNPQSGTLCQKEAVGCDEYNSSKGSAYFKDPALSGNKICSFQTFADPVTKQNTTGWFWKGVSVCGNSTTKAIANPTTYCTTDTDCSGGNTCLADYKDKEACYPNYQKSGNYYDLWSFGDTANYQNFVGECPAQQDTCSEFVDHADKDQAYYLLDNNKVSEGDCSGQVSQKAGCALFDQTDNPNKLYNTAATYAQSDSAVTDNQSDVFKITKVVPNNSGTLDANRIISVKRDRECAEWLQCKASTDRWDDKQNKFVSQCSAVGLCDKLPSASNPNGQSANCAEFITGQSDYSNKVLTEGIYTSRDVSWKGKDLVGLSILGSFPIEELWQFNIAKPSAEPDWRLLKLIPCGSDLTKCAGGGNQFSCKSPTSTDSCGTQSQGTCINGLCMEDNAGTASNIAASGIGQGCRAYPEKDSPFPNVAFNNTQNFAKLNKCFESGDTILNPGDKTAYKCECDYTKATFGDKTMIKYFSQDSNSSLQKNYVEKNKGICVGGSKDSEQCDPPVVDANGNSVPGDCEKSGGACKVKDKKTQDFYGWKGFCLEYDKSRILGGTKDNPQYACMSWLPLDLIEGAIDINNNHPEAAAQLPVGTKYCLASDLYRSNVTGFDKCYDTGYSVYNSDKDCNLWIGQDGHLHDNLVCGPGFKNEQAAMSGVKGCENYDPDWCYVHCIPEEPKAYADGAWFSKLYYSFQDRQVACQAYAQFSNMDNKLATWSDRLWQFSKSNFKNLDVSGVDVAFKNKVNYSYGSTSSPFAFLGDEQVKGAQTSIYLLRSCQAAGIFGQPLSTAVCPQGSGLMTYKNTPSNNFAYDNWSFGSYSNCSTDVNCNPNIVCANHVNNSVCQYKCKKADGTGDDAKCKTSFGKDSVCNISTNSCTSTSTIQVALDCNPANGSSNCESHGFLCSGSCSFGGVVSTTVGCSNDTACYQNSCEGDSIKECIPKNSNSTAPTNDKPLLTKVKESLGLLLQIYSKIPASSIKIFSNDASQSYRDPIANDKLTLGNKDLDVTNIDTNYSGDNHVPSSRVPQVHPVGGCDTKGNCQEIFQDGFNVNNIYSKNVIIDTKPYEANFQFFYNADSNHMPVKRVVIDPDTGNPSDIKTTPPGSLWNQRGYFVGGMCKAGVCNGSAVPCSLDSECSGKLLPECTADEAKADSFGYILNKTCDLHPYASTFYYSCSGKNDPRWNPTCDVLTGAEQKKWQDAGNSGCCVYQPKVQVLDNWGWCNGVCKDNITGANDGTESCYNGNNLTGWEECNDVQRFTSVSVQAHSNTFFKYKIVVPVNKVQ